MTPPWIDRLVDVQDRCLVAPTMDDALAGTLLQLVERLLEAGEERAALRALVSQAAGLLTTPRTRLQIAAWLEAAAPYVEGPVPSPAERDELAPIEPRD